MQAAGEPAVHWLKCTSLSNVHSLLPGVPPVRYSCEWHPVFMQEKYFIQVSHSAVCAVELRLLRQGPLRYVHTPGMLFRDD